MDSSYPLKVLAITVFTFLLCLSLPLMGQSSPEITDISNQQINEGESFAAISLDDMVADPDHTDDQLVWDYEDNDELLVSIENHVALVRTPDVNWFGNETITFTVTDPDSQTSSDDATFTVLSVNDAPLLEDIPGQSISEGASFVPINLDNFVSDIDNNIGDLTWTASDNPNVSVDIDASHVATVEPDGGWSGTETISFSVQDPAGETDSDNADFTVTATEAVPVAADDNYVVDEGGTLSTPAPGVLSNDSDADGDALSAVLTSNPLHDSGFNLGEDGSLLYEHDGSPTTSDAFTYAASDGKGQSSDATVSITVNPVNDNPVIGDIPDQSINEGQNFESFDLDNFVSDEEDADNLLAWEATGSTNLKVNINPGTHIASIDPPNNTWSGSETITFTVSDSDKGTVSDNATFSIASVAEAPTDILLSPSSINENSPALSTIGALSTVDADAGDSHTYDFVSGTGDDDNGSFNISGNNVILNTSLNFETKSSYTVRIRTTDSEDLSFEKAFSITVIDINEDPTDIDLSDNSIEENKPANTVVGTLSTTDPDAGESFTYTLVTGAGSDDNSSFNISGNQLRTSAEFDFEVKSSYNIRIRTTDSDELFVEVEFTITVTDANGAPTDITLSNATVQENQVTNTVVGNLSTTDPDPGDTFTYTLIGGTGSTDNSRFNISGNQLRTSLVFDFETKSSYSVRIRTSDGEASYEEVFVITVTDAGEAPTNIALSATSVNENLSINTVVGDLTSTDADAGETFTYTLESGSGSTDNSSFNISGDQLRTNAVFDFEVKSSYSIRIRTTDSEALFFEKEFTITVTDANGAPTDITLSNASVQENQVTNTVVGNLSTTDPDPGNTFTYTLVGGTGSTDNTSFNILNNQLRTSLSFDFETKSSYSVRIQTSDGQESFEKVFAITVTDANDAPVDIALSANTIMENQPINTVIGIFTSTDPDADETFSYSLVEGSGSTDNSSFNISGDQLRSGQVFDFEAKPSYNIRIRTTDSDDLTFEKAFTVIITNENDPPVATNVNITANNNYIGTVNTGNFDFSDPEGDQEGTHTYQWYRSDNSGGTSAIPIENANTITYVPVIADLGKWISFEVTPMDEHELPGIPVKSPFKGPLGEFTASISGSGTFCEGTSIPVILTINGGTQPYRAVIKRSNSSQDIIIDGITTTTWEININLPGTYTLKELTDVNNDLADISLSSDVSVNYRLSPKATISGNDSICVGESTNLTVTLTDGEAPWSFTYVRDGESPVTRDDIQGSTQIVPVNQPGIYTLTAVSDETGAGCVTGQAIVIARTPPTATISGTATICEHTSGNLSVALTGKSPWKFGYSRNLVDLKVVENVSSSPKSISVMKGGTYRVYEVIDRYGCSGSVSGSAVITITPAPDVEISGIKAAYNIESSKIDTIIGSPAGGTFTGPAIFGILFIPRLAPLGTHNIIYTYRASPASCYGYDTAQVSILESNAIINFENKRTKFCLNDAPFTVTGVNLEGSEGEFTISGGKGLVPSGPNTATVNPSELTPNKYTISYSYSIEGEAFQENADFDIGNPPSAVFNPATECFHEGQSISFVNASSSNFGFLTDTSYSWKIYTPSGFDSASSRNINYTFNDPDIYEVELRIENSYGCTDTAAHDFNLRPTIDLESMYLESFEDNPISWQSGKSSAYPVNSWQLGNPSKHGSPPHGFSGAYQGTKSWFTNITSSPAPREQSWVTSPCFDFTGIDKPMLTMQIWRLFNSNRDGANIQFTTDSAKTWNLVGELEDGENWFNSYDIRGLPGNSAMGWSNNNGISNDGGWVRTRHALDFLKGKTDVQFRISYGSGDSPQNNDGIAFDNFLISERTKMVLIEHFTNSSLSQAAKADSILDELTALYGDNIVDIQYHTASPSGDPFYAHNPLVPTARQFYYGLSGVPYAVIDGGNENGHQIDYNDLSKPLKKNTVIVQSLEDSEFDIRAEGEMSGDIVNVHVWLRPKVEFPLTELSVRIAIVERIIDQVEGNNGDAVFRNVVKAMLPDAAGTLLYRSWNGEDEMIDLSWNIENVYDREELEVVAFLQNESTREIYNVDVDSIVLSTGTDFPTFEDKKLQFTVFPNPVRHLAKVTLSEVTHEDVLLELYDNVGRLIYSGRIPAGDRYLEIPVEEYREGLYLLRLFTDQKVLGIRKVIIIK